MKRYKLLKPLPGIPVDMPFLERTDKAMFARRWYVPAERVDGDNLTQFSALIVENNPEWFEEVQEKKWTDRDMIKFFKMYAPVWINSQNLTPESCFYIYRTRNTADWEARFMAAESLKEQEELIYKIGWQNDSNT